jgi:2-dehydro-3-deoxyphosphogluconate aldolase/(4S)-4-hydroxy-2-oxoglutarate aldolase
MTEVIAAHTPRGPPNLFPAQQAVGIGMLRAIRPVPGRGLCPTGGITPDNAAEFPALPNVACVGGSWLTPPAALKAEARSTVEALARKAAALWPPR